MKKFIHGSIASYFNGFLISLFLTIVAYIATVLHINSGHGVIPHDIIIALVLCLAVLQLFVQLILFLHLGSEKGSQWNLVFFISTASIIILVVLGSLWIMYHLNYNMMPRQMEEYLIWNEGMHN